MDRWSLMIARALAPAGFAVLAAFVAMRGLTTLRSHPIFSGLADQAWWVPLAMLLFAALAGARAFYRLRAAERGEGLLCSCGGLLGRERDGRYGPYRRCLACSDNVARRGYE